MEQYNTRKIDGLGRIVLHRAVRRQLSIEAGSKLLVTPVDTIVILQHADDNAAAENTTSENITCEVDQLGMVALPKEIRQTFGWKENDEIALYQSDNLIILKSA